MRALRDAEFQASLSKQNALKYTQNALNQTGYANQGLSESTALGIQNNYRNALLGAQQQYRNEIGDINRQQFEYNANEATNMYNDLSNRLLMAEGENGTDTEELTKILKDYNLVEKTDQDGNKTIDFNGTYYSPSQQDALNNIYRELLAAAPLADGYVKPESDGAKQPGAKIHTNSGTATTVFTNGTGTGKTFTFTDKNGITDEFTMGDPANAKAQTIWESKQIGDVWVNKLTEGKDAGAYRVYVKDQNGIVRMLKYKDQLNFKEKLPIFLWNLAHTR